MIGAIAGDIIGSVHEHRRTKTMDFVLFGRDCFFTDDSVLTIAVADSLMTGIPYTDKFHEYFQAYPRAGYGMRFTFWAGRREREPYNSWGNGSAMRVSPVGFAFGTLEEVVAEARRSAEPTHNHAEGIRGAEATAAAIFLGRTGKSKEEIRSAIESRFGYDLSPRLDDIRPDYSFDESCRGTVPPAIIAFLESRDYEDAIRKAISLGGGADTLRHTTIAEALELPGVMCYGQTRDEAISNVERLAIEVIADRIDDVEVDLLGHLRRRSRQDRGSAVLGIARLRRGRVSRRRGRRQRRRRGQQEGSADQPRAVLRIQAGGHRSQWPGHRRRAGELEVGAALTARSSRRPRGWRRR